MKKMMGAREMAEKWGVSERRIRLMCQEGRIEGAVKLGWSWSIPSDTPKPGDGRFTKKYKSNIVRLGSIDIRALNELRDKNPLMDKLYTNVNADSLIADLIVLGSTMDGNPYKKEDVLSVFQLTPSRNLDYQDCLKISAFRSILLRSVTAGHVYGVKNILGLHAAFTQGWDDRNGSAFRQGFVTVPGLEEAISISLRMETFFMQYDREWVNIHPVFKAVIMMTELIIQKPFEQDNALFAILAMAAMLLSDGFLPPTIEVEDLNELNADLSLAGKRYHYENLARMWERCIFTSYGNVFRVG